MYVPTRSKPTSSIVVPEVGSAVNVDVATVIGDGEFGSSFVFAAVIVVAVPAVVTMLRTNRFPPAEVAAVLPIRKPRTLARTVAARSAIWVFGAAAPAVLSIAANAAPAISLSFPLRTRDRSEPTQHDRVRRRSWGRGHGSSWKIGSYQ